jgi:hypothetical protein
MSNYQIFAFCPAELYYGGKPHRKRCKLNSLERKVPMLGRETRVPPGFAVENVARIGSSIWSQKSTIFDNQKDTGFEVDRARFSAPAAAEKTHSTLYREDDNNQKEP